MGARGRAIRTNSYTSAVIRHGAASLGLITLVAVIVHGVVLHERCQTLHRHKLESFVQQGVGQLADLGGQQNAAVTTSWSRSDGPVARQFRRWAWGVLGEQDVITVALLDEQGRLLDIVPQDAAIPRELIEGVDCREVSASVVPVGVGDRQESVWRVAAVTRRDGSAASQAGLLLFARLRPTLGEVARSAVGLAAAMVGGGGILLLIYGIWFARRVRKPLCALAAAAEDLDTRASPPLPVERNDEIGAIARALEGLRRKVNRSEGQVERLERTMDSRVKDQTRQINAMLRRAERAAWIDPLTKLGNRRLLEDRLERVFEAQQRTGQDMSMVMLDLDNFKNLNDTCGHSAGDDMLRFVGELLRGTLRPTDVAVRYGGDEFVIILVDTTPEDAAALTERLVRLFRQRAGVLKLDPPVSMSAGIASLLQSHPGSGKDLLEMADQALYKAKSGGKSCLYAKP